MRRLPPPGPPRAVLRVLSSWGTPFVFRCGRVPTIRTAKRPQQYRPSRPIRYSSTVEPESQELTMKEPERIKPTKLADYLEVLSKAVFEGGMNWEVIESKWPGFQEAFDGFDPEKIASYSPEDIDRLMADPRIIRNGRKVNATIHNAGAMIEAEKEFGGF